MSSKEGLENYFISDFVVVTYKDKRSEYSSKIVATNDKGTVVKCVLKFGQGEHKQEDVLHKIAELKAIIK